MLFVLLRDLLGNVMETVEASKVDRLPVRGSVVLRRCSRTLLSQKARSKEREALMFQTQFFWTDNITIHFTHCMLDGAINIFTSLIAGLAICFNASACRLRPGKLPAEVHRWELSRGGGDGCCACIQC